MQDERSNTFSDLSTGQEGPALDFDTLAKRIAQHGDACVSLPARRLAVRSGGKLAHGLCVEAIRRARKVQVTGDLMLKLAEQLASDGQVDPGYLNATMLIWQHAPRLWDTLHELAMEMTGEDTPEDYMAVYTVLPDAWRDPDQLQRLARVHARHRRMAVAKALARSANAALAGPRPRHRQPLRLRPPAGRHVRARRCLPRARRPRSQGRAAGSRAGPDPGDPDPPPGLGRTGRWGSQRASSSRTPVGSRQRREVSS